MSIFRIYSMHAAKGSGEALERQLRDLGTAVSTIDGCEGIEVVRDMEEAHKFLFIERWSSVGAHRAGSAMVPGDTLRALKFLLERAPSGSYFETVLLM